MFFRNSLKTMCLALQNATKKWTIPTGDWKLALSLFVIRFEGRHNCEYKENELRGLLWRSAFPSLI